jgi:hypothetical protein
MTDGSFTITRGELYRALAEGRVRFEHERIDTYNRYDWSGKMWRNFPGIGYVRWDSGDPGDEDNC